MNSDSGITGRANALNTLVIDIGGTGIKAMVLDEAGEPTGEQAKEDTPRPALPESVLDVVQNLARSQPAFDRVTVGFPGVIRNGVAYTAANLDPAWHEFDIARSFGERLGKPTRVANDADIQGFGSIKGQGLELVLTLGTGLGSALFIDGILVPNLEVAHHPFRDGKTYEQLLGKAALEKEGEKTWLGRLDEAIALLRKTFNFDMLYIGGGNSARLDADSLAPDVQTVHNIAGLLGGIALWHSLQGT
jgi:polyphosphate glucokinase